MTDSQSESPQRLKTYKREAATLFMALTLACGVWGVYAEQAMHLFDTLIIPATVMWSGAFALDWRSKQL